MTKYRLEYIWLDGYTPVPNLRGKTQLKDFDSFPTLMSRIRLMPNMLTQRHSSGVKGHLRF
jgi:hypothetical protein